MPKLVYDRWPGVSCPLGRSAVLADQTAKDLPTPDPGGDIGRVAGLPLRRLLLQPLVWTVAVIVPGVLCQDAPEQATDPEFLGSGFFDARDAVQVKYEMVRKVRVGGSPVTETAAFGYSRSAYYAAAAALESSGLEGWAGPARADASKLIEEILAWAEEQPAADPTLRPAPGCPRHAGAGSRPDVRQRAALSRQRRRDGAGHRRLRCIRSCRGWLGPCRGAAQLAGTASAAHRGRAMHAGLPPRCAQDLLSRRRNRQC